jgi:hypothetical protein
MHISRRLMKSYTKSALRLFDDLLKKLNIEYKDIYFHFQNMPNYDFGSPEEIVKCVEEDINLNETKLREAKNIVLLIPVLYLRNSNIYR